MLQVFILTELFLLYFSALILSDTYGTVFLSLINLHKFVYGSKTVKKLSLALCAILLIGNVFLPVSPGPMLIGDFLPVVTLFLDLIVMFIRFSKDANFIDIYKKYDIFGFFSLGVAVVHFLFPRFVIL